MASGSSRWLVYLLFVHLGLGGVVFWKLRDEPWWFLGLEMALVVSFLVGMALARRSRLPRDLLRTGMELMREEEFGSRLAPAEDPDTKGLVGLFNEMMDRLRRERLRVQERELLLHEVITASPAGFVTLDHDERIELANPAAIRLLDAHEKELEGRSLRLLDHPLARELAALRPGDNTLVSSRGHRLRLTRGRFYDRGFPRSFLLIEELTEELRASERAAYDRLIRMISHEVKNSVGAVISLLQSTTQVARELPEPRRGTAARALGVAEDRLRNLDRFVNGFADVVRLPAPDLRPVDLTTLLDDLHLLLGPELEERQISWRWLARPTDGGPVVSADKNQLEQALVNVLRNAIEAVDREGELLVSLEAREGAVRLTIADSGPGLADPVRDQVFVPFVSTKRDGRGLGLTLIREILEGHGFRYGLENRPEGGAVFRIEM
jgi:nitrogen fixation/metabolism regulation signal transduction histidine kinase